MRRSKKILLRVLYILSAALAIFAVWFYGTEHGTRVRLLAADSLLTTRHGDLAWLLLGKGGAEERKQRYLAQFDRMAEVPSNTYGITPSSANKTEWYEVKEILGKPYKGFFLYVYDPLRLRIAVTGKKDNGETVSSMVNRLKAEAGVNGGAFIDPEFMGDGSMPSGIVVSGGQIIYNSEEGDEPSHIVGIDAEGRLIAGKYTPSEVLELGIQEAVTFAPRFIAEGKGLIKDSRDGWGIAPRTAIGQLEDGTIVFAIIDGRQLHSAGATLYDLQQLYMEIGAVTAANLDGGASSELVVGGKVLNKPATRLGERPIPTAWLLFENPEQVEFSDPWVDNE